MGLVLRRDFEGAEDKRLCPLEDKRGFPPTASSRKPL